MSTRMRIDRLARVVGAGALVGTIACSGETRPAPDASVDADAPARKAETDLLTQAGTDRASASEKKAPAEPAAIPTLLRFRDSASRASKITAGVPVQIALHLPEAAGFSGPDHRGAEPLNVGRFVARLPGGVQESLPTESLLRERKLSYTFKNPGAAVIMLCIGPDGSSKSDAWQRVTYCSKTVLEVADPSGKPIRTDAGSTDKAGLPIEVWPLVSPLAAQVGSDLPVKLYLHGQKMGNANVVAHRPDGTVDTQTSNPHGVANFRVTATGPWVIRYETEYEGRPVVGEYVFSIPDRGPANPR